MASPRPVETSDWIDISRPLRAGTPVWPGDRPYELTTAPFGSTQVSALSTSCHVGSHIDAPNHVQDGAAGVESVPLARLIGPAEVVKVPGMPATVTRDALPRGWEPAAPRLLLRTETHPLDAAIGLGFASLDPAMVPWLAERGVELVGIDTPSVDAFDSSDLPAHHALVEAGMVWLEGLWLVNAEPGLYMLAALPLLLEGADAAPLRAALRWIAQRPVRQ